MAIKNFGYLIHVDRQIDLDKADFSLKNFLEKSEPSFKSCFFCGTCTATCSAANFTNFSLRKINTLIKRGEVKEIYNEIEKCMLCGKCQLACPRNVNTRNIICSLKQYFSQK